MRGVSHALSGVAAGLAAGIVLHDSLTATVALSGFTAGAALLPDMDQCSGTASRSLGFLTEALAKVIGKLSGGHRHFTHGLAGVALFTLVAWLGVTLRHNLAGQIVLGLMITVMVSSALEALRLTDGHVADVIGLAVAGAVVWYGYGLSMLALATVVGCLAHIAGDCLTVSGCPLAYPLSRRDFRLLPRGIAFVTGTWRERLVVDPLLLAGIGLLAADAMSPGIVPMAWHHALAFAR